MTKKNITEDDRIIIPDKYRKMSVSELEVEKEKIIENHKKSVDCQVIGRKSKESSLFRL